MKIIETIKTKYGVRRRVALRFTEEDISLTDQSQKDDTDINNIVDKFIKTKDPTILKQRQGLYADVSEYGDLSDAYLKVQNAEEAFMSLPSALRAKLNNNPVEFINYMNDPKNIDEAVSYGLMSKKPLSENLDNPIIANPPNPAPVRKNKNKQQELPTDDEND